MNIQQVFDQQADACFRLGSPFTAQLLRLVPQILKDGDRVADRILNWPGDISGGGDSVPLRLAGALHAVVRLQLDADLMQAYPPNMSPSDKQLASKITAALDIHADFILNWMKSPPQTNEVARSAALIPAGWALSKKYALPLTLLELGTSAGLNLQWDRYALLLQGSLYGPTDAEITLQPDWTGEHPLYQPIRIAQTKGVDLNPLDASDPQDRLRLLSYIWPDQATRLSRTALALDLARKSPPNITKAGAIDWLQAELAEAKPNSVTVVFHSIAWQYFPTQTQTKGRALIKAAGARATEDAPVAWLSMEADGKEPGAALTMRVWPGGQHINLARVDFHGRWIDWKNNLPA